MNAFDKNNGYMRLHAYCQCELMKQN